MNDSFNSELSNSIAFIQKTLKDALTVIDSSKDLKDYVLSLGLYLKVPFFLTLWCEQSTEKLKIEAVLAMHIVSMKLFDDLVDRDNDLSPFELGGACLHLLHESQKRINQKVNGNDYGDFFSVEMTNLIKGQLRTKTQPAKTFEQWLTYAECYGGGFLRIYGRLSALLAGRKEFKEIVGAFAFAFGMIITIADDITDYTKKMERDGNIEHMVRLGSVNRNEILGYLNNITQKAHEASKCLPKTLRLKKIIDLYATDIIERILPMQE